jgi:hypothetical protein
LSDENAFLRKFYIVDTKRTNTAVRLLASLAADAAWLLAQPSLQAPLFSLRRRALGAAIKHGLVERGNAKWLRVTKLRQWATEAYKPSYIIAPLDGPLVGTHNECVGRMGSAIRREEWWQRVLAGDKAIGDPLPWLLMIRATGHSVESLLSPPDSWASSGA